MRTSSHAESPCVSCSYREKVRLRVRESREAQACSTHTPSSIWNGRGFPAVQYASMNVFMLLHLDVAARPAGPNSIFRTAREREWDTPGRRSACVIRFVWPRAFLPSIKHLPFAHVVVMCLSTGVSALCVIHLGPMRKWRVSWVRVQRGALIQRRQPKQPVHLTFSPPATR